MLAFLLKLYKFYSSPEPLGNMKLSPANVEIRSRAETRHTGKAYVIFIFIIYNGDIDG